MQYLNAKSTQIYQKFRKFKYFLKKYHEIYKTLS